MKKSKLVGGSTQAGSLCYFTPLPCRKRVANPIGTFWTGALLLDHLGEKKAAARLLSAIEAVVADKANHCPDLGGRATTRKVTDAVIAALETRQQIS